LRPIVYLSVFGAALLLSLTLTRMSISAARRRGWLDLPSPRRIHTDPTPRLGGVAMFLAFASVIGVLVLSGHLHAYTAVGLLGGAGVVVLVGFVDDVWGLGAGSKFLFQTAAALATVLAFDIVIRAVTLPFIGRLYLEGSLVGYGLTVFWILGMINTINFADGIDGLVGGLTFIFSLILFVVGVRLGQRELPLYACALGGVALGFLRYNFAPARVFMGDSGSMFLGFAIAVLSVVGTAKLAAGLLVMGIWVADVAYSIIRRARTGAPVQMPDKEHLHHRFVSLGLSQRLTAGIFWLLALAFGSAALLDEREGRLAALLALGALSLLIIWLLNRRLDRGSKQKPDVRT
jgi:UDP-GlcNAc:undecaprenyl-phosphate GlcNAc-1-phosphate transferase